MTPENARQHYEYIELGSRDLDAEARAGLSLGLKETYFEGLEALVLNWYMTEYDMEVSHHLLDHLVRQSHHCPTYEEIAIQMYEKETVGSVLRQRMQASAAGTALYAKFKHIDYDGPRDLFRGETTVTKNIYNILGIQGGAVSIGGDAENTGSVSIYSPQVIESIRSELSKAERELHSSTIPEDLKSMALEQVHAAKADTTPAKIDAVITVLRRVESIGKSAAGIGTAIGAIVGTICKLAGLGQIG